MKKKYFFNMVEVLLALGVTAIGVTGLMGIIPIAMRANSDAQAEYFVSNAADSMYAWFENLARSNYSDAFSGLPTTKPTVSGTWSSMDRDESDITEDGVNFLDISVSKDLAKVFVGKKNKLFADFTGDIAVWKNASQKIADFSSGTMGTTSTSAVTRVFLEISWPSTSPYDNRNKRIFVREFVDPDAMLMEHSK